MVYEDLQVSQDTLEALCFLEGIDCDIDRYLKGTLPRVQEKRLKLDGYRIENNLEGECLLSNSPILAKAKGAQLRGSCSAEEVDCDKIYEKIRSGGLIDIFKKAYNINPVSAKVLVHKYERPGIDNGLKILRDGSKFHRDIGRHLIRIPIEEDTVSKIEKEVEKWKA